jgi:hypothetical protein
MDALPDFLTMLLNTSEKTPFFLVRGKILSFEVKVIAYR